MSHPEDDMTTDLWARFGRLFGNSMPSRELDQVLAGWRAADQQGYSRYAVKRELLHPMKGWVVESPELAPNDANPQWKVRHPAHNRTRAR